MSVRFEGSVVAEARYKTKGCTASIAAGSALAEWLAGKVSSRVCAGFRQPPSEGLVGGLDARVEALPPSCA